MTPQTSKRSMIIYGLMLLLPTVVMVGAGFRLLIQEKDQIRMRTVSSLSDRALSMAGGLELTVSELEDTLTRSLMEIPADRLSQVLLSWEKSNPLVRNVFVWQESGLSYPEKSMASTAEERRFINRYEALFTGRMAWDFESGVSRDEKAPEPLLADESYDTSSFSRDISRMKTVRKDLLELAQQKEAAPSVGSVEMDKVSFAPRSGWIPWFAENQLFILGWVQTREDGPVYGIELEFMALLSRLITQLPVITDSGIAYGLFSGDGHLLHQSGAFPIDDTMKPVVTVPVSGLLPHYSISFYLSDSVIQGGKGVFYLFGILLALLAGSLILGGALMIRDSQRSLKDARQKTSFVSNVSHELKTPLTSIRMYAELLRDGRVKAPEKIAHYLSVIVSESQRLTRLVNNVLDFGKLSEGKKTYHESSFDLCSLIREIIDAHGVRLADAGMKVTVSEPENSLHITSDRDALEQVVLNLLDNAVKYAAKGGELSISLANGDCTELVIRDRGPGIPDDHKDRIFDTFHRVDNSLTAGQAGSGLGLSIARRIMRDLGGDLVYEPNDKGGCCFRIRIRQS